MDAHKGGLVNVTPDLMVRAFTAWRAAGGIKQMVDADLLPPDRKNAKSMDSNDVRGCLRAVQKAFEPLFQPMPDYIVLSVGQNKQMEMWGVLMTKSFQLTDKTAFFAEADKRMSKEQAAMWRVLAENDVAPDPERFFFQQAKTYLATEQTNVEEHMAKQLEKRREGFAKERAKAMGVVKQRRAQADGMEIDHKLANDTTKDDDAATAAKVAELRAGAAHIEQQVRDFEAKLEESKGGKAPNVVSDTFHFAKWTGTDWMTVPALICILRALGVHHVLSATEFNSFRRVVLRAFNAKEVLDANMGAKKEPTYVDLMQSPHGRMLGLKIDDQFTFEGTFGSRVNLSAKAEEEPVDPEFSFYIQYAAAVAKSDAAATQFHQMVEDAARAVAAILRPSTETVAEEGEEEADEGSNTSDDDDAPTIAEAVPATDGAC